MRTTAKNGLMGLSDNSCAYPNAWRSWPRNTAATTATTAMCRCGTVLARSLNTIAIRVGDLVGAKQHLQFCL